ncbi:glycosyltransferase family 2 protein [Tritonibacter horizontis]|uniref:Undecaprenyl-phosphate 4-deoxy-4-formamido-L-arabinose transferase n=1 Tax=Tritonibacter horizontis TaxID=1768241 RepID=A0A132BW16_9RHOB|nr:glycosyltransferase family 2 protein [Tritonibacter horizontis]KUP92396.1 undecaprenyl-phosphate 4-deoxy-4-formamido-L-arabinose transferase [Tritonibacter horizontis]
MTRTDPQQGVTTGQMAGQTPIVTIISPMHNEAGNVAPLLAELEQARAFLPESEVILVDDGSRDGTARLIGEHMMTRPWLRLVQHGQAAGQSAAVHSGVLAARGWLICTLDGDLQNPPAELPNLCAPLLAAAAPDRLGLVAGQRQHRQDRLTKKLASRAANTLRAAVLNDNTRDTGCGLKAFRRAAFLELPYFNHMHRYLPALFARAGWEVAHVDVAHRAREAGASKYTNLQRALVGISDLLGVAWLVRRSKTARPQERSAQDLIGAVTSADAPGQPQAQRALTKTKEAAA